MKPSITRALANSGFLAALTLICISLAAGPALAHNVLLRTSPENGSTVATVPQQVVLTFDKPALALGTAMTIIGPSGNVASGPPRLVDTTVIETITARAPAGAYTVRWRVTSADGHPVSGSFTFNATTAGGNPTATTDSPKRSRATHPSSKHIRTVSACAVGTGAEDLESVADVDVLVVGGHLLGPAFDGRAVHLDGASAAPADQVVVMAVAAPAVGRLAICCPEDIDFLGVGEHLQGSAHGGQADPDASLLEQVVDLLCAAEVVDLVQDGGHGGHGVWATRRNVASSTIRGLSCARAAWCAAAATARAAGSAGAHSTLTDLGTVKVRSKPSLSTTGGDLSCWRKGNRFPVRVRCRNRRASRRGGLGACCGVK